MQNCIMIQSGQCLIYCVCFLSGLGAGAMPSGYGATPDATASMYGRAPAPARDVTGYAPTAGGEL